MSATKSENDPGSRFWRFALAVYGDAGAREAFLQLQDDAGLDTPLALWCLWRGAEGERLTDAAFDEALAFSVQWRAALVGPVRALRRAWKGGVDGLPPAATEAARQALAKAEIAIERLQMEQLAQGTAEPGTADKDAMVGNLAHYAAKAEITGNPHDFDAIQLAGRKALVSGGCEP